MCSTVALRHILFRESRLPCRAARARLRRGLFPPPAACPPGGGGGEDGGAGAPFDAVSAFEDGDAHGETQEDRDAMRHAADAAEPFPCIAVPVGGAADAVDRADEVADRPS